MKTCRRCGEQKPFSKFPKRTRADGMVRYEPSCFTCINKAARDKREQLENNFFIERNDGFVFVFNPKQTPTQKRKKEAWNNVLRVLR